MNNPALRQMMENMGQGDTPNPMSNMTNNPMFRDMMQNMSRPAAPADSRPPEERYESQLAQLQGMGFTDATKNIRALQASGGNVEAAVEYLFNN